MSTHINFLNLKLGLLYQKHYTWKNHKAQSPINQMLKYEIGERKIYKKIKKITIKKMRIKIEVKNKLEGNYKFLIEEWKLKRKITLIKGQRKSKE